MDKFKDLAVPLIKPVTNLDYCDLAENTHACAGVACNNCLFYERNKEVFEEWLQKRGTKDGNI